jgi:hypothetical protein
MSSLIDVFAGGSGGGLTGSTSGSSLGGILSNIGSIFGGSSGGASSSQSGGMTAGQSVNLSGDPIKLLVALIIIGVVSIISGDWWWAWAVLLLALYYANSKYNFVSNASNAFDAWITGG